MVNTGKVIGRRKLRFATVEDALADVNALVAAQRAGTLQSLGNWTLGQALGHLAMWITFAYDGTPITPPLWARLLMRLGKKKFMYGSLPAGFRIPRIKGGTLGIEPISLDEGVDRYRRAMQWLQSECPALPNPAFGRLTHDEWIALHLRHAELHLSFFQP
jgi:hypothetical protein